MLGVNNLLLLLVFVWVWWSFRMLGVGFIGDFWWWMFGDNGGFDDCEVCLERERFVFVGKRDLIGGGVFCECFVSFWIGWKREILKVFNVLML